MAEDQGSEGGQAAVDPVVIRFAGNRAQRPAESPAKSQAQDLLDRQAAALTSLLEAQRTIARVLSSLNDKRPGAGHDPSPARSAPRTETSFFPALDAVTEQIEAVTKAIADDAADLAAMF